MPSAIPYRICFLTSCSCCTIFFSSLSRLFKDCLHLYFQVCPKSTRQRSAASTPTLFQAWLTPWRSVPWGWPRMSRSSTSASKRHHTAAGKRFASTLNSGESIFSSLATASSSWILQHLWKKLLWKQVFLHGIESWFDFRSLILGTRNLLLALPLTTEGQIEKVTLYQLTNSHEVLPAAEQSLYIFLSHAKC